MSVTNPTLIADDIIFIRQAAVSGLGIAQLPLAACLMELRQGLLQMVLPEYRAPLCEIQVVFPSRRGLLPVVRSLIDCLSAYCFTEVLERQIKRHIGGHRTNSIRFWTRGERSVGMP